MKTHLIHTLFLSVILFIMSSTQGYAQKQSITHTDSITGNWEGNIIVSEEKSVGILWRFELSDAGMFTGYMGPASKGIATIPMQDLIISDTTLSFTIHSEGSYVGTISGTKITGNWTSGSGKVLSLNMARELTKEQISDRFNSKKSTAENTIYQSIELGDISAVKIFLDKGNDINMIDEQGFSLLFYAIKNDRKHTVTKYLLDHGANPNLDCQGISPLMYAIAYQNHTVIKELINHKAAINYISTDKQTALLFAIKGRDIKAIKLLLDYGVNPNQILQDNYSAIDVAKKENIREVLEVLNIPYEGVSDGPYVQESEAGRTAIWIHKGETHLEKNISITSQTIQYEDMSVALHPGNLEEEDQLEYQGVSKVAAISDIHGQYDTFIKLLKNNNIINQQGKWSFGQGHFVVAGDIFDRGSQVTEVLWFLYDLENQAQEQGGKVHVLLGNHDVMVLNGNLRSVHPKYTEVATILGKPFHTFFTDETVLGNWLRTRPVVVKINTLLFTHGGLHPDLVTKGISLNEINREFKNQLIESELSNGRNELGTYLHRGDGPIYYRGYFQGELATDNQIDQLLQHFKATNIIVGHTTHRHIETRYNGKVIVIDANMKSGEMAEILLWQPDTFTRGNLAGEKLTLE
ncbi:ankyrin repeat domain-containing protein [Dokdonia sp.]|uniref:ankyrin repeat domain-containing protein n=1 Tax=Dokdonia sp. TaxID=2024995 RepID=UPI00326735D0